MSMKRRVDRLERRLGAGGDTVLIMITGGFSEGREIATADGHTWRRRLDEEQPDFVARVRAEALAVGATIATIGGLED
jgi:hypothetical protein